MKHFFLLLALFMAQLFAASNITVVSMAIGDDYQKLTERGTESKRLYCEQQGYDFVLGTERLDAARPIPWSKILLLLEVMDTSTSEWLFWADADALIMNNAIRLESFIDENYNIIICDDINSGINSGHFFIRNCEQSRSLLRKLYTYEESIHHIFWENHAFYVELTNNPKVREMTKIVPQRLFNSFPRGPEQCVYQPGDFIVHFAGFHDRDQVAALFDEYTAKLVAPPQLGSLDSYLESHGFKLSSRHSSGNEGYVTKAQEKQFADCLKRHRHIRSIAEIGLNGGHSAYNFVQNCPHLEHFLSFDINHHAYTKVAAKYLTHILNERFTFVAGDSMTAVPSYKQAHPGETYDLIYIDGNHSYENCLCDILNCRLLAHANTIVWVDDYEPFLGVGPAVDHWVAQGLIEIIEVHESHDPLGGRRSWVEVRYVTDN